MKSTEPRKSRAALPALPVATGNLRLPFRYTKPEVCWACGDDTDELSCTSGGTFCGDCLLELSFGIIRTERAKAFYPGAGCPLEPNDDDNSPWGEKVAREREDRQEIVIVPADSGED